MASSEAVEVLNRVAKEIETRLWDVITEFHFHLNDIAKWREWGAVEQERLAKLRLKLKHIVLDIMLEHALEMDAREEFTKAKPGNLVKWIKALTKEAKK